MSSYLFRTLNLLAIFLTVIAQPALHAQQLAANTPPEIFAISASSSLEVQPSLPGRTDSTAELDALVISSNVRTITPAVLVMVPTPDAKPVEHPFWDRQNRTLFAANAAMASADFFTTRRNLAHNGRELNPLTRPFSGSSPALAANFAMQTGAVIGVSYLFHKTGHHKLERATSYVNLGASVFAVSYGLTHR